MPARKIFLSHASADRKKADRIAKVLRSYGLEVWYSPHTIGGAEQWQDEIGSALGKCNWFLVLLSPKATASMWVKRELQHALTKPHYKDHIVPVLLRACKYEQKLSWTLSTIQVITMKSFDSISFSKLLDIWNITYNPKRQVTKHRSTTP